eukprot:TRINITY_DN1652_c0_g1_i2.p1 TRINITY_DN1652_c0_g1~~TRINITY_DN1652_c0_g1_i2.p1  ORF type:complete len:327 (-),score=72.68 TRINITY_DN1652_c0_g1_i2:161-1141(-)
MEKRLRELGDSGRMNLFDLTMELTLELNVACFGGHELNNELWPEFRKHFFGADPQTNTQELVLSLVKKQNACTRAFNQLQLLVTRITEQRLQKGIEVDDFIARLVRAVPALEDGSIDFREITLCLYGFLFAAQTNTYAVMGWTLTHLLEREGASALQQALTEQDMVIQKHGTQLSLAALDDMTYLGHCINEAARLEVVGSSFRAVLNDQRYKQFTIPKGYIVCLYTASVHLNDSMFSDANRFDPDRYLPGREEQKRHPYSMLMFGGGPHACLGKRFVTLELKAVLAMMLRSLHMELGTNKPILKNPRQVFFTARPVSTVSVNYSRR